MKINNEFEIGDIVYLRTDEEQKQRIITGITIRPGFLIYHVSHCNFEGGHYDFEITKDKNYLL